MGGVETATHSGVYWTVAISIAVLVGVVVALGWRLVRERRASRLEHERLTREADALRARLESQQQELQRTSAQLADRSQRLEQQGQVLANVERDLEAQAAELARANEHHAELLANLSNEIRTPLNSALILSQLLADNGSANLTPVQVKFARTIYSAGNDLLELLNDILDLSKIEAGKVEIHRQPLAVSALVAALEQAVGPIAEQKRLDLAIRLAPNLPETVDSDAQRLPQVLKNLLATAIKLTDRGTVSLDINSNGPHVEFAARAADALNGRSDGAGLGLSLARELAPLLGGRIEVASEPGQVSTFRFIVPTEAGIVGG